MADNQIHKIKASIELKFEQSQRIKPIVDALGPDNINFPEGLSLDMKGLDNVLYIEVSSDGKIETLLNTIDEVLEHISLANKVIHDA
jgi:hypothetical protein